METAPELPRRQASNRSHCPGPLRSVLSAPTSATLWYGTCVTAVGLAAFGSGRQVYVPGGFVVFISGFLPLMGK